MNTKAMFDEAVQMKLDRFHLMGHCLWAVVSQTGMRALTVGEITKMVGLTSGVRPSTYQVKEAMAELWEMEAVRYESASNKGRGVERRYLSDTCAIAVLGSYRRAFPSEPLRQAVFDLTWEVAALSDEKLKELKNYNKQIEGAAESN